VEFKKGDRTTNCEPRLGPPIPDISEQERQEEMKRLSRIRVNMGKLLFRPTYFEKAYHDRTWPFNEDE